MSKISNETAVFMKKTCGLMNYLGGNFVESDLEKLSFTEICDLIFSVGGNIDLSMGELDGKSICKCKRKYKTNYGGNKMNKYKVFFSLYNKKMVTEIDAVSKDDATKKLKDKITIYKIEQIKDNYTNVEIPDILKEMLGF